PIPWGRCPCWTSSASTPRCSCRTSSTTSSRTPTTRRPRCSSGWSRQAIWGGSRARGSTTTPDVKAVDLHVHLPVQEWLHKAIGPHLEATEAYFRARVPRKSIEEVAGEYAGRDILGVVLDWDDESVSGRGFMGNEWLASLSERFPGVLMGFGSVAPSGPQPGGGRGGGGEPGGGGRE